MIEVTVLNYLKSKLTESVLMQSKGYEGKFVLIERTGGGLTDKMNSATFAVQSYADSMYDACVLNEKVKTAMLSITDLKDIGWVKLNSDYNFTDQTTKKYRYQSVFEIHYIGE